MNTVLFRLFQSRTKDCEDVTLSEFSTVVLLTTTTTVHKASLKLKLGDGYMDFSEREREAGEGGEGGERQLDRYLYSV